MVKRVLQLAIMLLAVASVRVLAAEVAADQRQVAIGYDRLETLALRIADAVEADDPLRAEQVRSAISEARASGLTERFSKVVLLLEQQRYAAARGDQTELATQLEELLQLVMSDPREAKLEEQRRRLEQLRREIRSALREQRSLRARARRGQRADLAERQRDLARRVERLQEDAAEADRLAGVPEPTESADAPPQEGKADPNNQRPSDGPPSIRGKLQQGQRAMRSAGDKLAEDQDASNDQREAQRRLEEAQREADERLRQIREEEQQRQLVKLAERFRRMHEAEVGLLKDTSEQIAAAGVEADRATILAAAQLAARQAEVGDAADRALRLVRADGSSRVFDDVLTQTLEDIRAAEARLRGGRIDQRTADLESAVVESLADLIAAVDDSLDDLEQKKQQGPSQPPGGGGGAGQNPLIAKIAELRMIRSLQARLLRHTRLEHDRRDGGDESAERLIQLAQRQRKLARATAAISASATP